MEYAFVKSEEIKYGVPGLSGLCATRMYTNYATDLGLLGKTNDNIYLTPEGIRFTVHMQLHKGLKLVESMKVI